MKSFREILIVSIVCFFVFAISGLLAYDLSEVDGDDDHGDDQVLKGWDITSADTLLYVLIDGNQPPEITSQEWTDAVASSFQTWQDVADCYVTFGYEPDDENITSGKLTVTDSQDPNTYYSQRLTTGNGPPADAGTLNVIASVNDADSWVDNFGFSSGALAVTVTLFYSDTRRIVSTDMFVNGDGYPWTTSGASDSYDIQNVITHEAGHFIGIGHPISADREDTTMYFQAPPEEITKRDLADDDKYAAIYLYPVNLMDVTTAGTNPTPDNNLWGLRDRDTGAWTNTMPPGSDDPLVSSGGGGGGGCSLSTAKTHKGGFFLPYIMLFLVIIIFRKVLTLLNSNR